MLLVLCLLNSTVALLHPPSHIFDFTQTALQAWCSDRGLAPFRAQQILEWVYVKGVADPALMSNLAKRDRDLLAAEMTFLSGETVADQQATDGTRKLLVEWTSFEPNSAPARPPAEGSAPGPASPSSVVSLPLLGAPAGDSARQTECVMIPVGEHSTQDGEISRERRTACISSQVGCPVGCKFCASGIGGLDGNLSAGRIIEQVWRLRQAVNQPGTAPADNAPHDDDDSLATPGELKRISNVVFMGMGEPLSNFQNVMQAVRTLTAPQPRGMGIGARRITISTVGLPKAIEKLADELELPVTLALSLHAPNDDIRRKLIPWADYTTIPELLSACQKWFDKTGREITLEYILLRNINDRPEHARELAAVAKQIRTNINLIRYNEVKGMPFERPSDEDVRAFQKILRDRNVNVHIRASRGRDIAAACGQLRHEKSAK